ncbi:MAG: hypothetical protein QOJ99_3544 [Bryobacterales bacterium]|jgi:hypothetical protein|nr:hypothetical protein [Bryobacterales bacterium]
MSMERRAFLGLLTSAAAKAQSTGNAVNLDEHGNETERRGGGIATGYGRRERAGAAACRASPAGLHALRRQSHARGCMATKRD